MSNSKRGGRVSVLCWGWISHEGARVHHRIEGLTDGLQNKQVLQNLLVPSVRMLYLDGIVRIHQDDDSIHDSFMAQEWLSRQAGVEIIDRPPRGPDMNPVENRSSSGRRKPGPSFLPEIGMRYGPVYQTLGIKLLRLSVTFDH